MKRVIQFRSGTESTRVEGEKTPDEKPCGEVLVSLLAKFMRSVAVTEDYGAHIMASTDFSAAVLAIQAALWILEPDDSFASALRVAVDVENWGEDAMASEMLTTIKRELEASQE